MKGLIIYASKTKTTEKCSKILSEELDFKMVNIREKKPDISNYDEWVKKEEEAFHKTLLNGEKLLKSLIDKNDLVNYLELFIKMSTPFSYIYKYIHKAQ